MSPTYRHIQRQASRTKSLGLHEEQGRECQANCMMKWIDWNDHHPISTHYLINKPNPPLKYPVLTLGSCDVLCQIELFG